MGDIMTHSGRTGIPVHEVVRRQAGETPKAPAVVDGDRTLTYRELTGLADRLAAGLTGPSAVPEPVIGVLLPRSADLVIAELAVLTAGAAYLPLDPDHPDDRLARLCRDAAVRTVVSAGEHASRVPAETTPVLVPAKAGTPAGRTVGPRNLAYVMYTSGSSGEPKGVMVEHAALANFAAWHRRTYDLGPGSRVAMVNAPGFDASIIDVWPVLTSGACVVVADPEVRLSPSLLRDWLVENRITMVFLTVALAEPLLALPWPRQGALRRLQTGGEVLRRRPDATAPFVVDLGYGPTEDTVFATTATVDADAGQDEPPHIGRPITGTGVQIRDAAMDPVPDGAVGELYLGGAGLARGYLGRPGLTAELFVPDPSGDGERLYRTGDLVRRREDGTLAFAGRTDGQIKLRGNRIEPGEIEAVLCRHPALAQAHVTARTDGPDGQKRLVAYLVPKDGSTVPPVAELRDRLERALPSFMVPAAYVPLDRMPLTGNGKIDATALPPPGTLEPDAGEPPATPTERVVAEIWCEVLGLSRVGVLGNFFDLGGHSMLLYRVRDRLVERYGQSPPIIDFFRCPTVRSLARRIDDGAPPAPEPAPAASGGRRNGLTRLGLRRAQRGRHATDGGR